MTSFPIQSHNGAYFNSRPYYYHPHHAIIIFISFRYIITEFVSNNFKLPPHWSSKIPKRYKRNIINGELHRAKQIASNFDKEINRIRLKYTNAGYPIKFLNSVISFFNSDHRNQQSRDENKPRIIINLPFCSENENYARVILSRLNNWPSK